MRIMELCGDWGPENIAPGNRPTPRPGESEVLIRMRAASLNYRDFVMANRGYGRKSGQLPLIPVSDGAGEIVETGSSVSRLSVGELVCPLFAQTWLAGPIRENLWQGMLGGPLDGVMQEYMLCHEEAVVRAPRNYSALQASTLPCAALTAWSAVVWQGSVQPADTVLIQGTGGVSLFALQFAKKRGAETILLSSSADKLERASTLGADHLINYKDVPEWSKAVREITNGIGVQHIVEVGGAGTLPQSVRAIMPNGTISLIGVLAGVAGEFNLGPVVTQNVRLQGVTVGSREMHEAMVRDIEQFGIIPAIDDNLFAFEDTGRAIADFPKGGHFGKVCCSFE